MSRPIHVSEVLHYTIKNEAADRDMSMKGLVEDLLLTEMQSRDITLRVPDSDEEFHISELTQERIEQLEKEREIGED